jgi:hypothetical protein
MILCLNSFIIQNMDATTIRINDLYLNFKPINLCLPIKSEPDQLHNIFVVPDFMIESIIVTCVPNASKHNSLQHNQLYMSKNHLHIYHVRFEYDHNTMFYSEMQNDIKNVQINCKLEPNLMHFS